MTCTAWHRGKKAGRSWTLRKKSVFSLLPGITGLICSMLSDQPQWEFGSSKVLPSQPAHGCADMPGQLYPCREQTHRGAILPMDWLSKNLKQKGKTHNYRCANCHHLPAMLPTAGRDGRDALVPPGAPAGNGITAAYHLGVIIAFIRDHFTLFNALNI